MALKLHKLAPAIQDLHAFLLAHWGDRHLPGAGTFDCRKAPALDISTFLALMRILDETVKAHDWDIASGAVAQMRTFGEFLSSPRYAGNGKHLDNLSSAVERQDERRASTHLARLAKVVRPMAADKTFADNQPVSVIRTEHGWYDGHLQGRVKPGSGGHVVVDDEGGEHDIRHVRDIRAIR